MINQFKNQQHKMKSAHGIPLARDKNGTVWAYFGVEKHDGINVLSNFGGLIDPTDKSTHAGFLRELKEESLNMLGNSIDEKHLNDKTKAGFVDGKSSRFYVINANEAFDPNNDKFIHNFKLKRYVGGKKANGSNPKLHRCEKEVSRVRRVKVTDLLDYLANPAKHPNGLVTEGRKGTPKAPLPLRNWTKKTLDNPVVKKLIQTQSQHLQQKPIKVVPVNNNNIYSINSIKESLNHLKALKPGSIVCFDIDDTITTAGTNKKIVEKETLDTIKMLRKNGITVIAVTARSPSLQGSTRIGENLLKSAGVDLKKSPLGDKLINFKPVDSNGDRSPFQKDIRCLYENGILYTSNGNKGQALLQLLQAKKLQPSQVALFDDRKHNVEQMAKSCKENKINFLGFEYLAAAQKLKQQPVHQAVIKQALPLAPVQQQPQDFTGKLAAFLDTSGFKFVNNKNYCHLVFSDQSKAINACNKINQAINANHKVYAKNGGYDVALNLQRDEVQKLRNKI